MNLNELAAEIHEIAKSKGWWDEPRTTDDIIALCHSELSEALEAYRDGHAVDEVWWTYRDQKTTIERGPKSPGPNWKPEGVPVELADCVIRVLDYAAHEGWELADLEQGEIAQPLSATICSVHSMLSSVWHVARVSGGVFWASLAIHEVKFYLASIGHDLEALIRIKCAYNRTRPHRHGGKVI